MYRVLLVYVWVMLICISSLDTFVRCYLLLKRLFDLCVAFVSDPPSDEGNGKG